MYPLTSCQAIIVATIEHERILTASETQNQLFQIFKGVNLWRLFIAFWPKAMQQLAGQSVTNNYATYFCAWFRSLPHSFPILASDRSRPFHVCA